MRARVAAAEVSQTSASGYISAGGGESIARTDASSTCTELRVLPDASTCSESVAPPPRQIISAYLEPILIEADIYSAVYVGHRGIDMYRGCRLLVLWQILEHPEITLPRYYRVNCYRPRIIAPASSDLVREVAAVLGRRVRRDQLPVASLTGIVASVEVRTVTLDHSQRHLAKVNQYSVISQVLGRA